MSCRLLSNIVHGSHKRTRHAMSPAIRSGMILYAAADLVWASKIKGTADALGVACRPVRTMEMLIARLANCEVRTVFVDLDKGEDGLAMIRHVKGLPDAKVHVVAWGPHVAKELLQAARDAGADEVFTRGAFDHGLQDFLLRGAMR